MATRSRTEYYAQYRVSFRPAVLAIERASTIQRQYVGNEYVELTAVTVAFSGWDEWCLRHNIVLQHLETIELQRTRQQ